MASLSEFGINYPSKAIIANNPVRGTARNATRIFRAPNFTAKGTFLRWAKLTRRSLIGKLVFVRIGRPRLISADSSGVGEASLEGWINSRVFGIIASSYGNLQSKAPEKSGALIRSLFYKVGRTKVPRWSIVQKETGWTGGRANENRIASRLRYAGSVEAKRQFFRSEFNNLKRRLSEQRTFVFKFELLYTVRIQVRAGNINRIITIRLRFSRTKLRVYKLSDFISLAYVSFDPQSKETKVALVTPRTFSVDIR